MFHHPVSVARAGDYFDGLSCRNSNGHALAANSFNRHSGNFQFESFSAQHGPIPLLEEKNRADVRGEHLQLNSGDRDDIRAPYN
jgi:hypothetical protein